MTAIAYTYAYHTGALWIECAGLFWILAEMTILYFVLAGRRHIETVPLPATLVLNAAERRRAEVWALAFAALAAVILCRHFVLTPVYMLLAVGQAFSEEQLKILYLKRMHVHLAVWSAFVTVWVILETLIVYHGWRAYRRLREFVRAVSGSFRASAPSTLAIIAPLIAAGFMAASASSAGATAIGALHDAYAADAPYRVAVYLYLRLAGVVWITVEWIAALILWRGYRLMAAAARRREDAK